MKLEIMINNENRVFEVNPSMTLMEFLRSEGYYGVKNGCNEGSCGSCVVLVDDIPRKSCIMFVGQVQGHKVMTIEGLGTQENPHPIQDEFVENGAAQCGYCIPGMILSAHALLLKNPNPNDSEIKEAIDGNICRCTGYVKQIKSIKQAAVRVKEIKS